MANNINTLKISTTALALSLLLGACKKPAGEGGNSSIKGKVWVEDWDKNFVGINYQYAGVKEDVYIIYGDEIAYGDKQETNDQGEFEFKYLRRGKYKVYVFSDEKQTAASPAASVAQTVEVEITGKKQRVDAGTLTIKR